MSATQVIQVIRQWVGILKGFPWRDTAQILRERFQADRLGLGQQPHLHHADLLVPFYRGVGVFTAFGLAAAGRL
jgi:hypothetical protein